MCADENRNPTKYGSGSQHSFSAPGDGPAAARARTGQARGSQQVGTVLGERLVGLCLCPWLRVGTGWEGGSGSAAWFLGLVPASTLLPAALPTLPLPDPGQVWWGPTTKDGSPVPFRHVTSLTAPEAGPGEPSRTTSLSHQPQGSVRTEAPRKAPGSPLEPSQPPTPGTGTTSIPGNPVSRPYPPTFLAHKPPHHFTIFKQHTIKKQVLVFKKD